MISIKDVAERAGVSTATVSRVLSNSTKVNSVTKERVLATIKELNYRPNRVARSLRSQTSHIIGLIVADIQNPFYTKIGRAVEDVAHEHGMSLFLCNTDEDQKKEEMYLQLMYDENVAGVILSPTYTTTSANIIKKYEELDLDIVLIDRMVPDYKIDSVLIDNFEAAYKMVTHLIAAGHSTIAGIFPKSCLTGLERYNGYIAALEQHNIKPKAEYTLFVKGKEHEGYDAAKQILGYSTLPDAIFPSNGLIAAGAFKAINESGLVIPRDIAFATFDDTIWAPLVTPSVTVIKQPTYEIGKAAAELLIERIQHPGQPIKEVILKTELIVRESCGSIRHER